jgi:hypothetical protein
MIVGVVAARSPSSRGGPFSRATVFHRRLLMDEVPDLLDHLDDGRQESHDRARQEDPDHDRVSCVCCCFDCDE